MYVDVGRSLPIPGHLSPRLHTASVVQVTNDHIISRITFWSTEDRSEVDIELDVFALTDFTGSLYEYPAAINTNSSRTQEYPPSGNGPSLSSPKIHIASAKPQGLRFYTSTTPSASCCHNPDGPWPAQLNQAQATRVLPALEDYRRPEVFFTIDSQGKSALSSPEL
jgi:hypothetical protein